MERQQEEGCEGEEEAEVRDGHAREARGGRRLVGGGHARAALARAERGIIQDRAWRRNDSVSSGGGGSAGANA